MKNIATTVGALFLAASTMFGQTAKKPNADKVNLGQMLVGNGIKELATTPKTEISCMSVCDNAAGDAFQYDLKDGKKKVRFVFADNGNGKPDPQDKLVAASFRTDRSYSNEVAFRLAQKSDSVEQASYLSEWAWGIRSDLTTVFPPDEKKISPVKIVNSRHCARVGAEQMLLPPMYDTIDTRVPWIAKQGFQEQMHDLLEENAGNFLKPKNKPRDAFNFLRCYESMILVVKTCRIDADLGELGHPICADYIGQQMSGNFYRNQRSNECSDDHTVWPRRRLLQRLYPGDNELIYKNIPY